MDECSTENLIQLVKDQMDVKDYKEAFKTAKKLCEMAPDLFESHYFMAVILKMLQQEEVALKEVNQAVDIDPTAFIAYELALILLLRKKDCNNARKILDMLKDNELEDILSIRWCMAWLDWIEEKNIDTILKIYEEVANALEQSKEDYYWKSEFYYQYACLLDTNENYQDIVDSIEKGLQSYPEDYACLDYKAWLLKQQKQYQQAQNIYEKLVKRPHSGLNTEWELAGLYYSQLETKADKALELYQYILDYAEDEQLHYYAGMCEFSLGHLKQAEYHFLKEQELDPNDVDGYYRLSFVYEVLNRFEEALEQMDMALDIVRGWDDGMDHSKFFVQKSYILRKMNRMEEAAEAIEEADVLYPSFKKYPELIDIWKQIGNWKKVEETLKHWKADTPNVLGNPYESERCSAQIKYYLLHGNFMKAKLFYVDHKDALSKKQKEDIEILIDSISGKNENHLNICKQRYEDMDSKNIDYPWFIMHYANALWWEGNFEQAKEMAQKALDLLDEALSGFHRNRTVFMTERAIALFMLGQVKEAEDQLEEAQKQPMCEFCPCATCKDVDIYRMQGLIYQGKKKEALKLTQEYHKKWPEEMDFVFYENMLKKK